MLCRLGFCTGLSRKHVSDAYFNAELECELQESNKQHLYTFRNDADQELVMQKLELERTGRLYPRTPNISCSEKG